MKDFVLLSVREDVQLDLVRLLQFSTNSNILNR